MLELIFLLPLIISSDYFILSQIIWINYGLLDLKYFSKSSLKFINVK